MNVLPTDACNCFLRIEMSQKRGGATQIVLKLADALSSEVLRHATLWEANRSAALRLLIALGKFRMQSRNDAFRPFRRQPLKDAQILSFRLKGNFLEDLLDWSGNPKSSLYSMLATLIEEGVVHQDRPLLPYPLTIAKAFEERQNGKKIRLLGDIHLSVVQLGPQIVTAVCEDRPRNVRVWEIREADDVEKAFFREESRALVSDLFV